jgi:hypothetical protein
MSIESSQNSTVNPGEDISLKNIYLKLKEWFKYILSKWLIIVAFVVTGSILGIVYASYDEPQYTATTTFVLESEGSSGGLGQYLGLASMVGLDLGEGGGGLFHGDNIIELYKSRTMIVRSLLTEVIYDGHKQLLVNRFIEYNKLRDKWSKFPRLKNLQFTPTSNPELKRIQDSVLNAIVDNVNRGVLNVAKPDKKLSIIKVDVKSKDEFFSKAFNDQIVKTVNDFYVQTKTKKSNQNVAILQGKVDSVRVVMNGAIYSVAAVADATPNLNPTRQIQRTAPMQRSQFTAETNRAILTELVKNLEISKISLLKEAPLIQVVDQPVYPLKVEQFSKIKGLIFGGFIAGFLITVFFLLKKVMESIVE